MDVLPDQGRVSGLLSPRGKVKDRMGDGQDTSHQE